MILLKPVLKMENTVFLTEKPVLTVFLQIIDLKNRLSISFCTVLMCFMILQVRNLCDWL